MKKLLLAALFAAALMFAQHTPDASHGGAAAVNPGGPTAAEQGKPESAGREHAEAAAKHGEGHEEAPMPNEVWWKWANFAILAGGLGYLISKHAGPYFTSRSEEIRRGIDEASRTRQEAESRAAEIERRVSNLSGEIAALRAQSREEISREGERIRTETEAQLRKIQAQAEAEIQAATKHAKHELKAYSAKLALQQAERQLREHMDQPAQDDITGAFIGELRRRAETN